MGIHNSHFRRRISLEEQKAQKQDRFLRDKQIAYLIYEYFTGANDFVENYADLFTISLRNDDIQEFDSKVGRNFIVYDGMILFSVEEILASSTLKIGIVKIPRVFDEDLNSSTESTISTSLIHCIASVGNCEKVHTSVLNLIFQQAKVAGAGT